MRTALAWHKLHQQGYAIEQGAAHGSRLADMQGLVGPLRG